MDERGDDEDDDDSEEEWLDPHDEMSQEERNELDSQVHPVRLVLVKVSSNSACCSSAKQLNTLDDDCLSSKNSPMP